MDDAVLNFSLGKGCFRSRWFFFFNRFFLSGYAVLLTSKASAWSPRYGLIIAPFGVYVDRCKKKSYTNTNIRADTQIRRDLLIAFLTCQRLCCIISAGARRSKKRPSSGGFCCLFDKDTSISAVIIYRIIFYFWHRISSLVLNLSTS